MALNFGVKEEEGFNIFPHSRDFDAGMGKIRPGQGTVVVAMDGSGDCDTIQEGLKRLPKTGGVVYVKEGIYTIKSNITIPCDNVLLQGAGKSTQINIDANATKINITGVGYITLRDFYVHSTSGNTEQILVVGGGNIVIQDLWMESGPTIGILASTSGLGFKIENCSIVSMGTSSIECEDMEYPIITGNYLDGAVTGIKGFFLKNGVIAGNIIKSMTGDGILLQEAGSDGNVIANNVFLSMTADAVHIVDIGATKNIVLGNALVGFTITDAGTGTINEHNAT